MLLLCAAVIGACEADNEPTEPIPAAMFGVAAGAKKADAAQLAELQKVTARFHQIEAAADAGYVAQITPCWTHHSAGAMGYHFGDTSLFDATVDLLRPEVVIYEPQSGGHMRLVGMEYIVPLAAWEAAGHDLDNRADVPTLLGQSYTRHSFLPIFKLHIWLWRQNPSGMFADWNPKVSCANADSTEVF
jgi:hypothetical protein